MPPGGANSGTNNAILHYGTQETPASTCAWSQRTLTGPDRTNDKAYARSAHPVAAVRVLLLTTTRPGFPAGTPTSFNVE